MNTRSAQDHALPVDRKTFFRAPLQHTNAKRRFDCVVHKSRAQRIQIRMLARPEFCVLDLKVRFDLIPAGLGRVFPDDRFSVKYFHLDRSRL